MIESVLKEIIHQGIAPRIVVQETVPMKGKPAQKKGFGSTTVYIVKINFGGKETIVESARGGPREWASLDSLDKWLKLCGVAEYSISHSDVEQLLQPNLAFMSEGN